MKRILIIAVITAALYACGKETDPVYDTHLFQALQAQSWVFDSARITDSVNNQTAVYAVDSVKQINVFNSQLYTVRNIRVADSAIIDTSASQVIYNNPGRIYYYDVVSQQITLNHYFDIDTVNAQFLILSETDTLKNLSRKYFHAK